MTRFFDNNDWVVSSAGGSTGEAYIAESESEKIFLKRNSSPFLAVLSAEGVVPQLLWTKRLENGDVITAQKYLNGRELKQSEMKSERVATLLKKIHISEPLVFMLSRLGKEPVTPEHILTTLEQKKSPIISDPVIREILIFLKKYQHEVNVKEKMVCHTDLNHNNWLLDDDQTLYLVDWDQAIIADPALDLALLLYWYVDEKDWKEWLIYYGWELNASLRLRLHWYMLSQTLGYVIWHSERGELKEQLQYTNDLLELHEMTKKQFAS